MKFIDFSKISTVFWLEHYPRSVKGTVKALRQAYAPKKVLCVCSHKELDPTREKMGWTYETLDGVEFIYLADEENPQNSVDEIFKHTENAYHFFTGMRKTGIKRWFLPSLWKSRKIKKILWAERPTFWPFSRGILSFFYYIFLSRKINNSGGTLPLILAMGTLGVRAYERLGFKNVFPFLYQKSDPTPPSKFSSRHTETIRFVYVGQFDKRKGVDLMKKAFDRIDYDNWTLDIVGANGCFFDLMRQWSQEDKRIRFLGAWKSEEVEPNLRNYDACIVPSRYDGWGMVVAEALSAGIGVITTTRTGSRDLVESSGAGIIVKSGSEKELKKAIETVLKNPELAQVWKKCLKNYQNLISDKAIGEYLSALINWYFVEDGKNSKPSCPWLLHKQ